MQDSAVTNVGGDIDQKIILALNSLHQIQLIASKNGGYFELAHNLDTKYSIIELYSATMPEWQCLAQKRCVAPPECVINRRIRRIVWENIKNQRGLWHPSSQVRTRCS
jgi:hypothetical protein